MRTYVLPLLIGTFVVLVALRFAVRPYKLPTASMMPTLEVGDHLAVKSWARHPSRGDIIVHDHPKDPEKAFIKRVVAVGGDEIEVRDDVLYVNGQAVPHQPIAGDCVYDDYDYEPATWTKVHCRAFEEELGGHHYRVYQDAGGAPHSTPKVRVPDDAVYVMGDNRDHSSDSRYWGSVRLDLVRGTAWRVFFSWGPDGVRGRRIGHRLP